MQWCKAITLSHFHLPTRCAARDTVVLLRQWSGGSAIHKQTFPRRGVAHWRTRACWNAWIICARASLSTDSKSWFGTMVPNHDLLSVLRDARAQIIHAFQQARVRQWATPRRGKVCLWIALPPLHCRKRTTVSRAAHLVGRWKWDNVIALHHCIMASGRTSALMRPCSPRSTSLLNYP